MPGLLSRDPAVPVRARDQGADRGRADQAPARVVVEKPFGHDLESARELAAEIHQYIDESQLYRIDHFLGKMGIGEILYLRFANAMFEPIWNRNYVACGADHDGRELRGRGPRPLLRPGRRAARRGRQPPDAGGRGRRRWRFPRPATPTCSRTRSCPCTARCRRPIPATTCAGSTTATGRSTAWPPDSTTETYAALRLEIDNWRWSGVPFFIRTGKCLPVTQTELRRRVPTSAQAGLRGLVAGARAESARGQDGSRRPGSGCWSTPSATRRSSRSRSTSTWSSPRRAARARRPTRCSCTPR